MSDSFVGGVWTASSFAGLMVLEQHCNLDFLEVAIGDCWLSALESRRCGLIFKVGVSGVSSCQAVKELVRLLDQHHHLW